MEQGRRYGDVLACPGEARKGFIVGDDPSIHIMGPGTCAPTVSTEEATPVGNLSGETKGEIAAPPCLGVEQLRAQKREIDEAGLALVREYTKVYREIEHRGDGGRAHAVAHDVNRRIIADDETLPHFARATQNIATTIALIHGLLEATMPKDHWAHYEIRTLLEHAVAQQAEVSLFRRRELDTSQHTPFGRLGRDASVH